MIICEPTYMCIINHDKWCTIKGLYIGSSRAKFTNDLLHLKTNELQNCKRVGMQNLLSVTTAFMLSLIRSHFKSHVIWLLPNLQTCMFAYKTWFLYFRSLKAEDAGKYECQVSTEPKLSHFVHLTVIGK